MQRALKGAVERELNSSFIQIWTLANRFTDEMIKLLRQQIKKGKITSEETACAVKHFKEKGGDPKRLGFSVDSPEEKMTSESKKTEKNVGLLKTALREPSAPLSRDQSWNSEKKLPSLKRFALMNLCLDRSPDPTLEMESFMDDFLKVKRNVEAALNGKLSPFYQKILEAALKHEMVESAFKFIQKNGLVTPKNTRIVFQCLKAAFEKDPSSPKWIQIFQSCLEKCGDLAYNNLNAQEICWQMTSSAPFSVVAKFLQEIDLPQSSETWFKFWLSLGLRPPIPLEQAPLLLSLFNRAAQKKMPLEDIIRSFSQLQYLVLESAFNSYPSSSHSIEKFHRAYLKFYPWLMKKLPQMINGREFTMISFLNTHIDTLIHAQALYNAPSSQWATELFEFFFESKLSFDKQDGNLVHFLDKCAEIPSTLEEFGQLLTPMIKFFLEGVPVDAPLISRRMSLIVSFTQRVVERFLKNGRLMEADQIFDLLKEKESRSLFTLTASLIAGKLISQFYSRYQVDKNSTHLERILILAQPIVKTFQRQAEKNSYSGQRFSNFVRVLNLMGAISAIKSTCNEVKRCLPELAPSVEQVLENLDIAIPRSTI